MGGGGAGGRVGSSSSSSLPTSLSPSLPASPPFPSLALPLRLSRSLHPSNSEQGVKEVRNASGKIKLGVTEMRNARSLEKLEVSKCEMRRRPKS